MVKKTVLENGLRIITEDLPHLYSASIGIWVDNGSRDETSAENGISHFIEHMIFKGTRNRSALQIAKELDAIGGMSNAFTSKEQTCFHAKVLEAHLPQAVDILLDIFLNSLFDPEELERERQVVLQEICMVEDTPDEYIHVLFSEMVYQDNPLGQPILGTPDLILSLNQDKILNYLNRSYGSGKVIVAAAGKIDHQGFVDLVAPALGNIPANLTPNTRQEPNLKAREKVFTKDLEQVHLALGAWAPSVSDSRRADLVHHEVHYSAVFQTDVLGVLAPDFENGIYLRVDGRGGSGLGGNLIADDIGADEISRQIPSRSGGSGPQDDHHVPHFFSGGLQTLADGLQGSPGRHQVLFGKDLHLLVDDDDIGADGTDIHSQVGLNFFSFDEFWRGTG